MTLLSAALWYAEMGLAVFPLRAGAKVPWRGSHGLLEATTDPDWIRVWWSARPDANLAVATGGLVDVIDLDGADGLSAWEAAQEWPEPIGISATPRGRHLWIRSTGEASRAGIFPGVDYRGKGGYVVAPPSELPTGGYRWLTPLELP